MAKALGWPAIVGSVAILVLVALGAMTALARAVATQPTAIASALKPSFMAYGFWGVNTSEVLQAYPGASYLPMTVELVYLGPIDIYNVTAKLNISGPFEYVKGEGVPRLYVPVVQPGDTLRLTALLNVSPDASVGVYNETINVTYTVLVQEPVTNITIPVRAWSLVNFSLPITGHSEIRLVYYYTTPPVIYAGLNASELTVYLANEGTSMASNITVTLVGSGPVGVLIPGMSTVRIGYMPPGRVINVSFPLSLANVSEPVHLQQYGVSAAVPAPYNATLTLLITGDGVNESIKIPVKVYPRAYFVVANTYHSTLTAGSSDTYVTVTIVNVGGSEAKYLVATLMPNPIVTPYVSSSENPVLAISAYNYTVGDVYDMEAANLTFVISVSSGVPSGTYYVPVMLTWYQPPTMQVMHQIVLIPVSVKPSFSIKVPSLSSSNLILVVVAVLIIIILVAMALLGSRSR